MSAAPRTPAWKPTLGSIAACPQSSEQHQQQQRRAQIDSVTNRLYANTAKSARNTPIAQQQQQQRHVTPARSNLIGMSATGARAAPISRLGTNTAATASKCSSKAHPFNKLCNSVGGTVRTILFHKTPQVAAKMIRRLTPSSSSSSSSKTPSKTASATPTHVNTNQAKNAKTPASGCRMQSSSSSLVKNVTTGSRSVKASMAHTAAMNSYLHEDTSFASNAGANECQTPTHLNALRKYIGAIQSK